MHRFSSLLFFLLVFSATLTAQLRIEGCVHDEAGDALIGASVQIKGTSTGTLADLDGCFFFESTTTSLVVIISYTGFLTQEVIISLDGDNQIVLEEDGIALEEVVVTGLGRSSKREARRDRRVERRSSAVESAPAPESYAAPTADAMPSRSISSVTATTAGISPGEAGELHVRGSRSDATTYHVDGIAISDGDRPADLDDALSDDPVVEDHEEEPLPDAGQLTAGEVNDFGKWDLWKDVSLEDLYAYRDNWGYYPEHRYGVQLRFPSGSPVIDATLVLRTSAGVTLWETHTDNMGRGELWRSIFDRQDVVAQERLQILANYDGREYLLERVHSIQEGYNSMTIYQECFQENAVDVAFVVDATGSMGDEIQYLSSELLDVMHRSIDSLDGQDVRLGSVFYRDTGDEYVTRHSELSPELSTTVEFVKNQSAGGGGDTPEAVDAGLEVALNNLGWRENAAARLLFLVLDAPPHTSPAHIARLKKLGEQAAAMGVRIIPVVCSGMDQSGEYLMRSLALATNGTYTFLTDHSGIGGSHLEPSTDSYEVEKLNDLLVRLIIQFGHTDACAAPIAEISEPEIGPTFTEDMNWKVFPNPTYGPATVEVKNTGGQLTILDGLGKALRNYDLSSNSMKIDLSGLASGTYMLRYADETGVIQTERIILEYTR